MPLQPHDVHVWFRATESLDEAAIADAISMLPADELAHYHRFHFARDARDYAAAHALLRRTLSSHAGCAPIEWRFAKTEAGKPFLIDSGDFHASFSLSHTRGMVACALTEGADVGVDVECVDRDVNAGDIAARFFAPAEAAHLMQLEAGSRRDRFFDLWTLKEALVKALGGGMAMSLSLLAFTIEPDGRVSLEAPPDVETSSWQFSLIAPSPRHRLAVAVRRSPDRAANLILRT